MKGEQIFSYTSRAERRGLRTLLITFGVMAAFEAALGLFLIALIIQDVLIRSIVHLLHTSLCLLVLYQIYQALQVLKTHHFLNSNLLKVRYGSLLRADLPLENLSGSWRVKPATRMRQNFLPTYNSKKRQIQASLDRDGMVLLRFHETQLIKLGLFRKVKVAEILLNFDRREEFLTALDQILLGGKDYPH